MKTPHYRSPSSTPTPPEKKKIKKELSLWGAKPENLLVPLQSPVPSRGPEEAAVASQNRPFPAPGSDRAGPIQDCWGRGVGWGSK